jgi:hypothetical protein
MSCFSALSLYLLKVEFIGNHRSYNGRSGVWKQWRTFRFWFRSIQSKILLTKQRYGGCSFSWRTALWILRTFLQKLTTGPVTIEQRLSDSWVALLYLLLNLSNETGRGKITRGSFPGNQFE